MRRRGARLHHQYHRGVGGATPRERGGVVGRVERAYDATPSSRRDARGGGVLVEPLDSRPGRRPRRGHRAGFDAGVGLEQAHHGEASSWAVNRGVGRAHGSGPPGGHAGASRRPHRLGQRRAGRRPRRCCGAALPGPARADPRPPGGAFRPASVAHYEHAFVLPHVASSSSSPGAVRPAPPERPRRRSRSARMAQRLDDLAVAAEREAIAARRAGDRVSARALHATGPPARGGRLSCCGPGPRASRTSSAGAPRPPERRPQANRISSPGSAGPQALLDLLEGQRVKDRQEPPRSARRGPPHPRNCTLTRPTKQVLIAISRPFSSTRTWKAPEHRRPVGERGPDRLGISS